jgi:hypothetical protein
MFAEPERSEETISRYQREVGRLIAQCYTENPNIHSRELPIIRTARWFLSVHGRWSQIKRSC